MGEIGGNVACFSVYSGSSVAGTDTKDPNSTDEVENFLECVDDCGFVVEVAAAVPNGRGEAGGVGGTAVLLVLVHAIAIGGETEVPGDVEAYVLAGLGGEALVQVHGVLVQLADRVAHIEQRQQACGMPSGTGGEFGALQQHHVGPSLQCEVVQRADADHAAANDYDAGMSFHVLDSPNANAPGSVTSTQLNMRLIATTPY